MKNLLIICFIYSVLVMSGCSLYQNHVLIHFNELSILPFEQNNQAILDYKVVYFDDSRNEVLLESRNNELSVYLSVGKNVPFLVYPVAKGSLLKPAGAIFPNHYDEISGVLRLDWRLGPLAEMVMKFVEKGYFLEDFNLVKLEGYLLARFSESPWDWDQTYFIEALMQKHAGYFDIRKREKVEITLDLAPEIYFSEFPGVEGFQDITGRPVFPLFQGYNRIYNKDFSLLYHIQLADYEVTIQEEKLNETRISKE